MYERFAELLKQHNMTAYKVGKELGIAQSTLSDWKTGKATPKIDKIQKIAQFFGVTYAWLMGWNEEEIDEAERKSLEKIYCVSFVSRWKNEIGETEFSDSEWEELSNYVKFMIAKRK